VNASTAQLDGSLTKDSAFSYLCRACNRCCHGYRIRVNPFEALTLARYLGVSTTDFARHFLDADSTLKHRGNDGSCVFLSEKGCTVHPARPLACRLYPLGRTASSGGDERFFRISLPITAPVRTRSIPNASATQQKLPATTVKQGKIAPSAETPVK
jgi:Fe-S-cluster containining protein